VSSYPQFLDPLGFSSEYEFCRAKIGPVASLWCGEAVDISAMLRHHREKLHILLDEEGLVFGPERMMKAAMLRLWHDNTSRRLGCRKQRFLAL